MLMKNNKKRTIIRKDYDIHDLKKKIKKILRCKFLYRDSMSLLSQS